MFDGVASQEKVYWFFDGKPVNIRILIRIEDERKEIGDYVADLLEEANFTVDRVYIDRTKVVPLVYMADPYQLGYQIYTEGWVATGATKWVEGDLLFFYGWKSWSMPGWGNPESLYVYNNTTVMDKALAFYVSPPSNETEYWETAREVAKLGIQESVRVFLALLYYYFPINKNTVVNYTADSQAGIWSPWFIYTVQTAKDHKELKIAEFSSAGGLFMDVWNPVGGLSDIYGHMVWLATVYPGTITHYETGDYAPFAFNYTVTRGEEELLSVPTDALLYNSSTDTWEHVKSGTKALVKVVYTFPNGTYYWHTGKEVNVTDIIYNIAFLTEWAHDDSTETTTDKYYDPRIEGGVGPILDTVAGFQFFLDNNTVVVYGNYTFTSDNVIANWFDFWPSVPWELLYVMSELVANNAKYGWYNEENVFGLDLLNATHVSDLKSIAEDSKNDKVVPKPLEYFGVTQDEAVDRFTGLLDFINDKEHASVGNGPYVVEEYSFQPGAEYMKLKRYEKYPVETSDEGASPETITVTVYTDETLGIQAVSKGDVDVFWWAVSADKLEGYGNIEKVKTTSTFYSLFINPAYDTALADEWNEPYVPIVKKRTGGLLFNPFAIREIRFALNYLISRDHIVSTILGGNGEAMYSPVWLSHYSGTQFLDVYSELGLSKTGDKAKALKMIYDAMQEWADKLAEHGHKLELRPPVPVSTIVISITIAVIVAVVGFVVYSKYLKKE